MRTLNVCMTCPLYPFNCVGMEARGVVVLCDIFRTGAQEHKSAGYSEMIYYQIIKKQSSLLCYRAPVK